ncbi:EF-hand domain-containing protein [Phragmitibacter flavus]|uniref:EF-hand domain-containing protein n=1 Tax=Phragmitibacter flavus TaxID=2576071 RepID=A0A5R8KK46_9BACT|nr:EF-hand domain-containing protein [Phragmitibacter flavus]TLD72315.1 EF-hand domain-containing protein [Phragmitibacter flavus]
MKIATLLFFGVLTSSVTLATAQDKGKPKGPGGDRPVPPEVLEKFDADKDGKLSPEERKAAREAREKEFDKDGDGKLNQEEKAAMQEAGRAKMLERFDKDGDGKLSEEERASMPRPPRGEGPPDGGKKGKKGPPDGAKGPKGPPDGGKP